MTTIPQILPKRPGALSALLVDLAALLQELLRLLRHALLRVLAHVLGDLHGAEMRSAHGAEMGELRRVLRQGLVVELLGLLGIEPEVELIFPAELEARLGERVVPHLGAGMAL